MQNPESNRKLLYDAVTNLNVDAFEEEDYTLDEKDTNKKIEWDVMMRKYKQNNFKRMTVLDHAFIYSGFHPK